MPGGKLSQEEFYKKYYPIVKDSVKGTGLFPETVIAQMAIESGWGGSGLTTKYNNYFGIKGGKGVSLETEEEKNGNRVSITDKFRVYNSVEDSIKDYVRLLTTNDKYKDILKAKSPEEQAELIGKSPYSTSSTYGSSIKNTIKSNQDKIKTMATNDDSKLGKDGKYWYQLYNSNGDKIYLKNKYASKEEREMLKIEGKKIALKYGPDSNESKKFNKELAERVLIPEIREVKRNQLEKIEKEYDNFFKEAKTDADIEKLQNLKKELDLKKEQYDFYSTKDAWTNMQSKNPDFNIRFHELLNNPESNLTKDDVSADNVKTEKPIVTNDTTGGGSGTSQTTTTNIDPFDYDLGGGSDGIDISIDPNKSKTEIEKIDEELASYAELEKYDFQPSGTYQKENDLLGTAMDIGKGVVGMIGATKEVPTYQRGSMFNSAMSRADARKDVGLSPEEMAFRERQGEEAYAYDIKNISRASGGNAGAYLGNVGKAVARLYGNKSAMAAEDEAVRRANNQNFQGMALQDEQINRQIFLDDLNLTMMEKQNGAALVNDAMSSMQERINYNRDFGNDSIYARLNNAKIENIERTNYSLGLGERNRMRQYNSQLEELKQKRERLIQDRDSKLVNLTPETKQPGLVTRTVTNAPVNPDSEFNSVNYKDETDALLIEDSKTLNSDKLSMQDEKIKNINENPDTVLEDTDKELEEYFKRKPKTKTRRRLITSNK